MDHPPSPIHDGNGPHSPPRELRHRMNDRYRPAPGYPPMHSYSQYPPPPAYSGGPPPSYGGVPPGYPPHRPPPGSYPPPSYSPYGYPPSGPRGAPYGYSSGFEAPPYPPSGPPPPPGHSPPQYRGSPPSRQHPPGPIPPTSSPEKHSNIGSSPKSTPSRSPSGPQSSPRSGQVPPTAPDQANEVERLRAAAAAEIHPDEVKPIQSDFHFFLKDNMAKYRPLAEEEVRKSMAMDNNSDPQAKLDPFLVNSNLNTRLLHAWEALTKEEREAYMVKEEADRRRFMEEDEIASRHCATLTARGKSPKSENTTTSSINGKTKEERQEMDTASPDREGTEEDDEEGGSGDDDEEEHHHHHDKDGRPGESEGQPSQPQPQHQPSKRGTLEEEQDEHQEHASPTKRMKIEGESGSSKNNSATGSA